MLLNQMDPNGRSMWGYHSDAMAKENWAFFLGQMCVDKFKRPNRQPPKSNDERPSLTPATVGVVYELFQPTSLPFLSQFGLRIPRCFCREWIRLGSLNGFRICQDNSETDETLLLAERLISAVTGQRWLRIFLEQIGIVGMVIKHIDH